MDIVLGIGQEQGWQDCEVFGHGSMITQPQDLAGWKLIPADLYEYSIPAEGVVRVLRVIQAGVPVKGIIIADDVRRASPAPGWGIRLARLKAGAAAAGKALAGMAALAVGIILLHLLVKLSIILILFTPILLLGLMVSYDPRLVILVDDGQGGTTWISVLTWYD